MVTLCLCALAAASAVAWALRVQGLQSTASVVPVALATVPHAEPAVVAKALGAMATAVADGADVVAPVLESSRFVLVGVVASGAQGAALIAVDGKPANSVTELLALVAGLKPGVKAELLVNRRQAQTTLSVVPGKRNLPKPGN